jgi:phage regulator Rha-like protein
MMDIAIIQNRIYEIREQRVMIDFDIAELYEVETRVLNQSVKRNPDRFPEDFMFRLTQPEWENLRSQIMAHSASSNSSQIVMSSRKHRGEVYLPFAFTEHGVTMLASVLRSKRAVDMNIAIVRAFIAIRKAANKLSHFAEQLNELQVEMRAKFGEHDVQLSTIYDALENLLDKEADKEAAKEKWEGRERIGFKKDSN